MGSLCACSQANNAQHGVVMVAAGWERVALAWSSLRALRALGCQWPIELWHLGDGSITGEVKARFKSELDVEPVDARFAAAEFGPVPPHREEAQVHCLQGDPLAYILPPFAVHLSRFSHVLLLFPDWVAFENVCVESTWRIPGSSAFFHAGSARVQDLAYYPKAWLQAGLSELLADEWEVDESALFLDKAQCKLGAQTVMDLVRRNVANAESGQDVSSLFPCGTNAYWRPSWELAGCSWHVCRFPSALLGLRTIKTEELQPFMGGGRGARANDDGRLLGVHFQWSKYFWLSRPSPKMPMILDKASLILEPVWDLESSKLTIISFSNSPYFHFVQFENCSRCDFVEVSEVISGSWATWVEIWTAAWREAFTSVVSCPENEEDWACWNVKPCPPRPCAFDGNLADQADFQKFEKSEEALAWEKSSVEQKDTQKSRSLSVLLPRDFGELWVSAGFAKIPRWIQLFQLCCKPGQPGQLRQGHDAEGSGSFECASGESGTIASTYFLEIVGLFESWASLLLDVVDARANQHLSVSHLEARFVADVQRLEGHAEQLQARVDLPQLLAPEAARFWEVFQDASRGVLEELFAEIFDAAALTTAVLWFGSEISLWFSLLHGAQIEARECLPFGNLNSKPPKPRATRASLAPGAGHVASQALVRLLQASEASISTALRGVEVGTRAGLFAEALLQAEPRLQLMVVDPFEHVSETYKSQDGEEQENDFFSNATAEAAWRRLAALRPRVHFFTTDSVTASQWIQDGSLDLVFIDADHSYDAVKADLAAWVPKLRKGGVLSGHDYNSAFPGVVDAVQDFFATSHSRASKLWLGPDSLWFTLLT